MFVRLSSKTIGSLWAIPFLLTLVLSSSASARPVDPGGSVPRVDYPGLRTITYRYGPIRVTPGDNEIYTAYNIPAPQVPGYITRFEPNLVRAANNSIPSVETLHLHHAGWSINGDISFSSGEEKTVIQYPRGFGLELSGRENWGLVYMLHNQVAKPEQVYLTWQVDFVPASSPASIRPAYVRWMDVNNTAPYGVFDALRGWGKGGRYTFPDQARGSERSKIGPDQRWVLDEDSTLVYTVGHLHPGGLYTTMTATRDGRKKTLFRSRAKYFGTRSPISYDLALSSTSPNWRVKLKKGDVVSISSTIDTSRYSWREQMGVMPAVVYRGHDAGGLDPFTDSRPIPQKGIFTHGSLPENRNTGGSPTSLADPRSLPDGPRLASPIAIRNFRYQFGDMSASGPTARPPVVSPGQRLSFVTEDSPLGRSGASAFHTVTACRAPCTATSGAAYPLSDSSVDFDSGQLGIGSPDATPASGRLAWSTPASLPVGTYTFFCRIHPAMRGAFRVAPSAYSRISTGWPSLRGADTR